MFVMFVEPGSDRVPCAMFSAACLEAADFEDIEGSPPETFA